MRWIQIVLSLLIVLMLAACTGAPPASTATTGSTATTASGSTSAEGATPTTAEASAPEEVASPTGETAQEANKKVVRLMTHDSFSVSEDLIFAFEQETGANLEVVKSGDSGSALNQAILSKANPLADVFFGVDNTFLSRALENDLFIPYEAEGLAAVPQHFQLDPEHHVTPIDYGDVCLNYDKFYFEDQNLPPPASLEDLVKPEYKGLTVVENPATSSPGLSFLLTTISYFGEDKWQTYWEQLRENEVLVSDGWEDAYYSQFSGGSGEGTLPIVVSYASSPAAEVFFADPQPEESPTASVLAPGTCFRQIEFAGILQNTKEPELAQQLIEFLLSPEFQEDVPLQMFVYPVRDDVALPEVFQKHAAVSDAPAGITPSMIEENREAWIESWTETVLR